MNLKINANKFLLLFLMILPLQDTIRTVLYLPSFLLLIYVFMFFALIYVLLRPKSFISLAGVEKFLVLIFFLYMVEMLISGIVNYPNVMEKNVNLQYYVTRYKPFWDEPLMSFIFAGIIRPFVYFSFSIFLIKFLNTETKIRYLVKSLILLGFFSSLYAIYQYFAYKFGLPFSSICSGHEGELITANGVRRCEGFFYEPGPHAAYLSIIFCYCICQFFNKIPLYKKKVLIIITSVIFTAMYLTLSPIGILTPVLIGFILLVNKIRKLSLKNRIIFLIFSTFLIGLFYIAAMNIKFGDNTISLSQHIILRLENTFWNKTVTIGDNRVVRSYFGLKLFNDHKIIGVGPGFDGYFFSEYVPFATGLMGDKAVVLNQNLKILVDSGIIGTVFYLIILLFPYYLYRKKRKYLINNSNLYSINIAGLYSILVNVLLAFNGAPYFFQPLFWTVYSITIAATQTKTHYLIKKEQTSEIY